MVERDMHAVGKFTIPEIARDYRSDPTVQN